MPDETRFPIFQSRPSATTLTDAYTVGAATEAVLSSLVICNTGSSDDLVRVSIAPLGATDDDVHYIFHSLVIPAKDTFIATVGLTLQATDEVRVYSTEGTTNFHGYGVELS